MNPEKSEMMTQIIGGETALGPRGAGSLFERGFDFVETAERWSFDGASDGVEQPVCFEETFKGRRLAAGNGVF
jgi:hypothetical protein